MEALRRLTPAFALVALILGLIAALALMKQAKATDERACIEAAEAKYPAVPVSAFVTKDRTATGPLKVSYIRERSRAVDDCR